MEDQMKDQIVLSYHNSLLRQSDFSLLDPPHWLNDRVIGFYFEYIEKEYSAEENQICFITPDVTQFIKIYQGPDLKAFLEPLFLHEKTLVILAVNDNSSSVSSGGSHWSTLAFDRELHTFLHCDSSSPNNQTSARQCAQNLTPFLFENKTDKPSFLEEVCPHQHNSYDCGVYALLFAKYLSELKSKRIKSVLTDCVTSETVSKWRQDTKILIQQLANT